MLAGAVAAALLAIVAQGLWRGRSIAARVARLARGGSRGRAITGWAAGTLVTYGLSAVLALALLGRIGEVATIPHELRMLAWSLGLPAAIGPDWPWIAGSLGLGGSIGIAILAVRRWLGRGPIGLIYRSPAAVRDRSEIGPAVLLSLAAGVGEELFFRLALPLSIALATGSAPAGMVVATAAFGLAHRHQGWVGVVATALVGLGLTWLYLWTGSLWVVMLLHVLVDLNALILRPYLSGR